jgi:hypothetical protein
MMVCAISNADWAATPLEGRMEVLETLSSRPASAFKTVVSFLFIIERVFCDSMARQKPSFYSAPHRMKWKVQKSNLKTNMAGGAEDGGAADLHRMELCIGWIYEYFSRHRLDEAREGSLLFLLHALT